MDKGHLIASGKTKHLYERPGQPDVVVVRQTDAISSGDGVRRDEIPGKGRLAAKTTARVFRLLNLCGLPTHYLSGGEDDDDNEMLARRCNMLPLEVVVRGVAAGSLTQRKPGIARGSLLIPRMIEFFFKDDANHDPLMETDQIIARGIASPQEIGAMSEIARLAFEILGHAWRRRDTLLVDLKIEFGRLTSGEDKGQLVIADVIDNDSWRIWPQGREELMLDKQMYRNLQQVTPEDLTRVLAAYERVADVVGSFPQMRPGMVAVLCDGPEFVPFSDIVIRSLQQFGLPTVRHIASAVRTPAYVGQLVQQLDVTFARLAYVTIGGPHGVLGPMVEGSSSTHVTSITVTEVPSASSPNSTVTVTSAPGPDVVALNCAKLFAIEDTVLFGRVLLMQANMRSNLIQADAQLNVPPQPKNGQLA